MTREGKTRKKLERVFMEEEQKRDTDEKGKTRRSIDSGAMRPT